MCGIVGVISAYSNGFSANESAAFTDMLVMDTVRGFDSTGAMAITNVGNLDMLKAALTGSAFVKASEYSYFKSNLLFDGLMAFGHNRAATRGTVNDRNAHPFLVNDNKICLLQNGTYRGSHKHHKDVEVDTEAIAHVIAEEDDVEKALQKVDAAYALVWYNTQTKTLHIIRNSERPLFIAYSKENTVMFASEPGIIFAAAYRNGIEFKKRPYEIQPGYLLSYTVNDKRSYDVEYREKLDIGFKGQPSFHGYGGNYIQQRIFPMGMSDDLDDDVCDMMADAFTVTPRVIPQPDFTGATYKHQPNAIMISIKDYCSRGEFNNGWFQGDMEDADTFSYAFRNLFMAHQQRPRCVEFSDYVPANNNPNCTTFFMIGRLVTATEGDLQPMVYATIFGKDETEICKMVTEQSIYMAKPLSFSNYPAVTDQMKHGFIPALCVTDLDPVIEATHIPANDSSMHQPVH